MMVRRIKICFIAKKVWFMLQKYALNRNKQKNAPIFLTHFFSVYSGSLKRKTLTVFIT
jgi:hypothetical protein